jgi:hypothetical protein
MKWPIEQGRQDEVCRLPHLGWLTHMTIISRWPTYHNGSPPALIRLVLLAASFGRYREVMGRLAGGGLESQPEELFATAREARLRAQQTVRRSQHIRQRAWAAWQLHQQACARAERLHQLRLSGQTDRMRYSATARLQARLASMPVIEQAKGVLMAQCGWTADEAFDALRRASQRSNIRVRNLAAMIVASTARDRAQGDKLAGPRSARPASFPTQLPAPQNRTPMVS